MNILSRKMKDRMYLLTKIALCILMIIFSSGRVFAQIGHSQNPFTHSVVHHHSGSSHVGGSSGTTIAPTSGSASRSGLGKVQLPTIYGGGNKVLNNHVVNSNNPKIPQVLHVQQHNTNQIQRNQLVSSPFKHDNIDNTHMDMGESVVYAFNNDVINTIWDSILQTNSTEFYDLSMGKSSEKEDFCLFCMNGEINYIDSKKFGKLVYVNPSLGVKYKIPNDDYMSLFLSLPTVKFLNKYKENKQTSVISGLSYKHNVSSYQVYINMGYAYEKNLVSTLDNYTKSQEHALLLATKLNQKFLNKNATNRIDMGLIINDHIFFGNVYMNTHYYLYKANIINNISKLSGYLSFSHEYKINTFIVQPKIIISTSVLYNYDRNSAKNITYDIKGMDFSRYHIVNSHYFDVQGDITTAIHIKIPHKFHMNFGLGAGRSKHMKNIKVYMGISF